MAMMARVWKFGGLEFYVRTASKEMPMWWRWFHQKEVLASIRGRRRKLEKPAGARTPRIENYQLQTVCARPTAGWKNNPYRRVNGV